MDKPYVMPAVENPPIAADYPRTFIKGLLSTGLGNITVIITGLLSIAIAARILEPKHLGSFILIETTAILLSTAAEMGLGISAAKGISGTTEGTKIKAEHISAILSFKCFAVAVIIIIGILLRIFFIGNNRIEPILVYSYWILIYFGIYGIEMQLSYIHQGLHNYNKLSSARIISSVLKLALVSIFLLILNKKMAGLFYASVLALGISGLYQYLALPGAARKIRFRFDIIKEYLKFGYPLWINSLITLMYYRIDVFLVGAFSGPEAVALYGIALKIPESLMRLFQAFESVYLPHMSELLSKKKRSEATYLMNYSIKIISFIALIGTIISALCGKDLLRLMFSSKYVKASDILIFLMLAMSFEVIASIFGYALVAHGNPDKPLKANIVTVIINIIGNVLLLPNIGLLGSALSRIVSRFITLPIYYLYLIRVSLYPRIKETIINYGYFIMLGIPLLLFRSVNVEIKALYFILYLTGSLLIIKIKLSDIVKAIIEMRSIPFS